MIKWATRKNRYYSWWNIITHINTKLFAWVKSVISISGPFWPCTILNALQVVVPAFRNQWTCLSENKNHEKRCPFIVPCLVLRRSMTGNYLRPKYSPRDSLVNSISRRTPWPTLFEHLLPDKDPKRRTMVDKPTIYGRSSYKTLKSGKSSVDPCFLIKFDIFVRRRCCFDVKKSCGWTKFHNIW